jgi:hypothetical protein
VGAVVPLYYFDIETIGLKLEEHAIITIQYAELLQNFVPKPGSDLTILKVWEFGSERDLIKFFLEKSKFFEDPFAFVPVGVNLLYDVIFLYERARLHGLVDGPLARILREKPFIDLKPVLVVLNDCEFKGYNRFIDMYMTTKTRGRDIPELYAKKEYKRIVEYIRDEYQATVKVLKQVRETLARLRSQLEGAEEGGE